MTPELSSLPEWSAIAATPAGPPVIEARGLVKRYGAAVAVAGIDLKVGAGEVVGLLGPNGAGKTTTILMLLGLTEASAGEVRILGHDPLREPLAVKRRVGYLPDQVGFYEAMTARENLAYTARLAGIDGADAARRILAALERVRLAEVAGRRVSTFSRGMRQRLGIAELLMRDCRVAILDEPTSGLDPQSTRELLELIRSLAADGMTVLLSSHMLDVVETVCTRVALFNRGRIGFIGTVDALAGRIGGGVYVIEVEADAGDLPALLSGLDGIEAVVPTAHGGWQIEARADLRAAIARRLVEAGIALRTLDLRRVRLDEAYGRFFEEADRHA
ncbi:ABC transporter ATP-binding protein [Tistrella mobilis]|uniref:ABC transporter ATP-binding protein n=1 Tax=Tistrella mobilis TaxID=171437 RepID=UPI00355865D7